MTSGSVQAMPEVVARLAEVERRLRTAEACVELIAFIASNTQIPDSHKHELYASVLVGLKKRGLEADADSVLAAAAADQRGAAIRELLRRASQGPIT